MHSIETLFEWLLAASLKASVLAVVILGIQFVLRHHLPAVWRHALWLPMLAVLVLPALPVLPATSFTLFPRTAVQPASVVASSLPEMSATMALPAPVGNPAPATTAATAATATPVAAEPSATTPSAVQKSFPFAIIWLVGTCVVLAAGFTGYHRNMRRIRMTATPPDRDVQAVIAKAARDAGLAHVPYTLISPAVASPAVTGFVRPVLLLPAGFPEGFSAAEARLILLHEFSHLKRLDLPLNWLMCVLQAAHWFNPLLWFAFARMRADREAACDARVLSLDATDRRAEYGNALIKLQCATPSRAMCLGFVGIFERGSEIQSRIREISAHRQARAIWRVAGGGILTLLMVFGMIQARPAGDQEASPAIRLLEKIEIQKTTIQSAVGMVELMMIEDFDDPDLPPEAVQEIRVTTRKFMTEFFSDPDLFKGIAKIHEDNFTAAELEELIQLYNSPLGRKLIDAQPGINQAAAQLTMNAFDHFRHQIREIMDNHEDPNDER